MTDLRPVLNSTTRDPGDYYLVYKTRFGEVRRIDHLDFNDAYDRKRALKARGYTADFWPMQHAVRIEE